MYSSNLLPFEPQSAAAAPPLFFVARLWPVGAPHAHPESALDEPTTGPVECCYSDRVPAGGCSGVAWWCAEPAPSEQAPAAPGGAGACSGAPASERPAPPEAGADPPAEERHRRRGGGRQRKRRAALNARAAALAQANPSAAGHSSGSPTGPICGRWTKEDPKTLDSNPDLCNEFLHRLAHAGWEENRGLLTWLSPAVRPLSLSKDGCRVVQKALDAVSSDDRDLLLRELRGRTMELLGSPHGNHVLQKMVEVMPPRAIDFIIRDLCGRVSIAARHKFGCRVLERLLEHCPAEATARLVSELIQETETLSRHAFGNFVLQHVLEHGTAAQRADVAAGLVRDLPALAQHRTASHVVQRALGVSDSTSQQALVSALRAKAGAVLDTACSRYGCFVVEQFLDLPEALGSAISGDLLPGLAELQRSPFGRRIALRLVSQGSACRPVARG